MITSEPLVEAAVRQTRNTATRFILKFRFSTFWPSPGFRRGIQQKQNQNLSDKERSLTELRFASFPHPLWGSFGLSRVQMNALAGALDSPPDPTVRGVPNFWLDMADDFIDGSRFATGDIRRWLGEKIYSSVTGTANLYPVGTRANWPVPVLKRSLNARRR
jgi:hypothetical protein